MPRPSSGTNLSLADLQSIMETRRGELSRLRKQRNESNASSISRSPDRRGSKVEAAAHRQRTRPQRQEPQRDP